MNAAGPFEEWFTHRDYLAHAGDKKSLGPQLSDYFVELMDASSVNDSAELRVVDHTGSAQGNNFVLKSLFSGDQGNLNGPKPVLVGGRYVWFSVIDCTGDGTRAAHVRWFYPVVV